jgi:molybdopterin-guanine dinucleotide biosynthesis protein A
MLNVVNVSMKISAVLLAGGESRRFGEDKATFAFDGKPLWERQLDTLRQAGFIEIILSGRTNPPWRPRDIDFAADAKPPCGPIGGLSAALAAMKGSHLLAFAIDMPFMTPDYLRSLIGRLTAGCGIVPVLNGEPEPLAAIYPAEAAERVTEMIKRGSDLSLRSLISKLLCAEMMEPHVVAPNETRLFQNINEPADVAAGRRFGKTKSEIRISKS